MINKNNELFHNYLKVLVDRVFKILPLYEEKNKGLHSYVHSMIYELHGLENVVVGVGSDSDYIILLATLESLADDSLFLYDNTSEVKREVFKCINVVKRIEESATAESGDK